MLQLRSDLTEDERTALEEARDHPDIAVYGCYTGRQHPLTEQHG